MTNNKKHKKNFFITKELINNMKQFLDNFKNYTNKLNEGTDNSQWKISMLMVIDRTVDRYKEDILSDLRAVDGITIINTEQHKNVKDLDYNVVLMKFDYDTRGLKSPDRDVPVNLVNVLLTIRSNILQIPGVIRLKYLTKPERF